MCVCVCVCTSSSSFRSLNSLSIPPSGSADKHILAHYTESGPSSTLFLSIKYRIEEALERIRLTGALMASLMRELAPDKENDVGEAGGTGSHEIVVPDVTPRGSVCEIDPNSFISPRSNLPTDHQSSSHVNEGTEKTSVTPGMRKLLLNTLPADSTPSLCPSPVTISPRESGDTSSAHPAVGSGSGGSHGGHNAVLTSSVSSRSLPKFLTMISPRGGNAEKGKTPLNEIFSNTSGGKEMSVSPRSVTPSMTSSSLSPSDSIVGHKIDSSVGQNSSMTPTTSGGVSLSPSMSSVRSKTPMGVKFTQSGGDITTFSDPSHVPIQPSPSNLSSQSGQPVKGVTTSGGISVTPTNGINGGSGVGVTNDVSSYSQMSFPSIPSSYNLALVESVTPSSILYRFDPNVMTIQMLRLITELSLSLSLLLDAIATFRGLSFRHTTRLTDKAMKKLQAGGLGKVGEEKERECDLDIWKSVEILEMAKLKREEEREGGGGEGGDGERERERRDSRVEREKERDEREREKGREKEEREREKERAKEEKKQKKRDGASSDHVWRRRRDLNRNGSNVRTGDDKASDSSYSMVSETDNEIERDFIIDRVMDQEEGSGIMSKFSKTGRSELTTSNPAMTSVKSQPVTPPPESYGGVSALDFLRSSEMKTSSQNGTPTQSRSSTTSSTLSTSLTNSSSRASSLSIMSAPGVGVTSDGSVSMGVTNGAEGSGETNLTPSVSIVKKAKEREKGEGEGEKGEEEKEVERGEGEREKDKERGEGEREKEKERGEGESEHKHERKGRKMIGSITGKEREEREGEGEGEKREEKGREKEKKMSNKYTPRPKETTKKKGEERERRREGEEGEREEEKEKEREEKGKRKKRIISEYSESERESEREREGEKEKREKRSKRREKEREIESDREKKRPKERERAREKDGGGRESERESDDSHIHAHTHQLPSSLTSPAPAPAPTPSISVPVNDGNDRNLRRIYTARDVRRNVDKNDKDVTATQHANDSDTAKNGKSARFHGTSTEVFTENPGNSGSGVTSSSGGGDAPKKVSTLKLSFANVSKQGKRERGRGRKRHKIEHFHSLSFAHSHNRLSEIKVEKQKRQWVADIPR